MSQKILEKIKGSIYAAAIGDALGGPLETKNKEEIRRIYGTEKVTDLVDYEKPRPQGGNINTQRGTYTDDTRLRNHLCQAIIEKEGRINAFDFAQTLYRYMDPSLFWPGEQIVFSKLELWKKMEQYKHIPNLTSFQALDSSSPRELGRGNIPACDMAMCISPLGLISPGNPKQAAKDAYDVGSVIQSGYSLGGAICLACAISEAMSPETNIDRIIETAFHFADGPLKLAVGKTLDFVKSHKDISKFQSWFHENMLVGFVDVLELIPATLGIIYIEGSDLQKALVEAANFGRDCDSIATSVGSLLGAFYGIKSVPDKWIECIQRANPEPDLNKLSEGIFNSLKHEITAQKEYVNTIEKYL